MDIPVAELEREIHPDGVADDLGWKAVTIRYQLEATQTIQSISERDRFCHSFNLIMPWQYNQAL